MRRCLSRKARVDGVYWHGMDRSLEEVKSFGLPRDKKIHEKMLTDLEVDEWVTNESKRLVRVTDVYLKRTGV